MESPNDLAPTALPGTVTAQLREARLVFHVKRARPGAADLYAPPRSWQRNWSPHSTASQHGGSRSASAPVQITGSVGIDPLMGRAALPSTNVEYIEVTPPERLVWLHSSSDADWNIIPSPAMANWPRVLVTTVTFEDRESANCDICTTESWCQRSPKVTVACQLTMIVARCQ